MSKFSALSFRDLQSADRLLGRLARGAIIVVEVECDDGSWCELDAESEAHARVLADTWVDAQRGRARGASCWRVRQIDGKLAAKSFYKVFEEYAHDWLD